MIRVFFAVAFVSCVACSSANQDPDPSCTDGTCLDGDACAVADDCASHVCNGVCVAATCTDGVLNGDELAADCGGACEKPLLGAGCSAGTNGSMVCTSYTSGDKFTVTITWNAAGGNAYVDYVTAYGMGEEFNSMGVVGGNAVNICTTGPMTVTFDLPLGSNYTYKIWHAYCVRTDACSGCGEDTTTDTGGPFGIWPAC